MRRILALWLFAVMLPSFAAAAECWPQWSTFRDRFVVDGRVVDPSSAQTTSEGQSYALFFALVANDRENFDRILNWTEKNLAGGSLSERLPAWQWGKQQDGNLGVLDQNSASDSDLWIAYALAEAGSLWKNPEYSAVAAKLAGRILSEETHDLPGLGVTLLPGAKGFSREGEWRLNPSYVPLMLVRRMALSYPKSNWPRLVPTSIEMILRASPRGFAPDWIRYLAGAGFRGDQATASVGSFDAIRVYLWAGMLSSDDPMRAILLKTFSPMAQSVARKGIPPLETDTRIGALRGTGPAGFSAALLPFLADSAEVFAAQRARIHEMRPLARSDNYYEQVLTLFGLGYAEGRFRFRRDGSLITNWKCA